MRLSVVVNNTTGKTAWLGFPTDVSVAKAIEFFAILGFEGWVLTHVGIQPALVHNGKTTYIAFSPKYKKDHRKFRSEVEAEVREGHATVEI